jgi:branched-chain amino acid transport system permease protein
MVIIGGLGTVMGAFLGAAFMTLFPLFLNWVFHALVRWDVRPGLLSQLELVCFGALIIFFLIAEPRGFARLWQIGKEKLRLWPFPH